MFLKIMDLKLKVPFYISIALCFKKSWGCGSSTSGGISQRVTFQEISAQPHHKLLIPNICVCFSVGFPLTGNLLVVSQL